MKIGCSLTIWYPRKEVQFRIGLFFGAASLAGAFSGLLAFGIGFMNGLGGLEGWSWIFVGFNLQFISILYSTMLLVDFRGHYHRTCRNTSCMWYIALNRYFEGPS
jgi:hypothetical protein